MGELFFLLLCFSTITIGGAQKLCGLLPNGNFEMSPSTKNLNGSAIIGQSSLPHWTIDGRVHYLTANPHILVTVGDGVHAVLIGKEASISQSISVKVGASYALTFTAGLRCLYDGVLRVIVPPVSADLPITRYRISDNYAWGFVAAIDTVEIVFRNPLISTCGIMLDAVAIKELAPQIPTPDNLVVNPGFEEGPFFSTNFIRGIILPLWYQDDSSPLPGWIVNFFKNARLVDASHFNVPYGKYAVQLASGRETLVMQVINTTVGHHYNLSFVVAL